LTVLFKKLLLNALSCFRGLLRLRILRQVGYCRQPIFNSWSGFSKEAMLKLRILLSKMKLQYSLKKINKMSEFFSKK